MRRSAISLLFVLMMAFAFTAHAETNLDKANGKWTVDIAEMLKVAEYTQENEMEAQSLEKALSSIILDIDARFKDR